MIIDDLTRDDIIYVIEHIHDFCACREDCINCPYSDCICVCTLRGIPAEWRPEAINKNENPA